MATMNALRAHHRGGPEVLVYETAPMPHPGPQEVLVRVHAASITFDELTWDATWTRGGKERTPIVPSHEVSGVVAARGTEVGEFAVGDGVYGLIPFDRDGAAADYVAVPANCLAGKPTTADHVHTSALPLAGLTAWQALVGHAQLQPGERVLVQGATGGVGGFVTQIATNLGAEVTATVRGSRSLDIARRYGAHHVVDTTTGDIAKYGPFDVVVDTVGGTSLELSFALLRRGGRHVTLTAPPPPDAAERFGITTSFFVVEPDAEQLRHLAELVDDGQLSVTIARTFPLSDGRAAYASGNQHPRSPGKTVLVL